MPDLAPANEQRLADLDDDRDVRALWDLRQRHLPEFGV